MNAPLAPLQFRGGAAARFTKSEFIALCESGVFDDMKIELVRGELERVNTPMSMHTRFQALVFRKLIEALDGTSLAAAGETGIDLSEDTLRGCDAAIVTNLPEQNRHFRPDEVLLAVEISVSTLERDLGGKRIDYATCGIENYWVVDPARSVVHVFGDPVDGEYAQVSTVKFDRALAVPGTTKTITIDD